MKQTPENEIKIVVDAYQGKPNTAAVVDEVQAIVGAYTGQQPAAPLDPDLMAVCAAAMKPRDGATPEERRAFENMQRIATGSR